MNIDELIATAQPRTQQVRICARGDLVAAHEQAAEAYRAALEGDDSLAGSADSKAAAEAVVAIEDEMEASTVDIPVSAVSRKVWADLLASHPPSKEQKRLGHIYDPETFSIAMVAACVDGLDEAKAKALAEAIPHAEWAKLENAAFALNVTETPHPKLPAATELLRANGQSSTTPPSEESPEDGSLAGSGEQ